MTEKISDLVGRIVATRPSDPKALARHVPAPPGGHPEPTLPDDLQTLVDVVGGGSVFGDFRMVREAVYHPLAAGFADEQRRALLPAPEQAIRTWYRLLSQGVAASPGSDGLVEGVLLLCGDYPAACWTRDTARAVLRAIDPARPFWPTAPQVDAVLRPIAERMRGRASRLDQIARADPATAGDFHAGPARESAEVYKLPPPPPPSAPRGRPDLDIRPPERTPEEQIRALGRGPKA